MRPPQAPPRFAAESGQSTAPEDRLFLSPTGLPLGLFFGGTAILLFAMAFVFTGQGILELQVSSLIQTTRFEGWPMVSWLGIFPTRETVLGQAAVLSLLPLGWLWMQWRNRKCT